MVQTKPRGSHPHPPRLHSPGLGSPSKGQRRNGPAWLPWVPTVGQPMLRKVGAPGSSMTSHLEQSPLYVPKVRVPVWLSAACRLPQRGSLTLICLPQCRNVFTWGFSCLLPGSRGTQSPALWPQEGREVFGRALAPVAGPRELLAAPCLPFSSVSVYPMNYLVVLNSSRVTEGYVKSPQSPMHTFTCNIAGGGQGPREPSSGSR